VGAPGRAAGQRGVVIVCLCRGVSEGDIRRMVAAGARTAAAVAAACGASGDCGACAPALADLVEGDARVLGSGART